VHFALSFSLLCVLHFLFPYCVFGAFFFPIVRLALSFSPIVRLALSFSPIVRLALSFFLHCAFGAYESVIV
jgi:hypothetical protein